MLVVLKTGLAAYLYSIPVTDRTLPLNVNRIRTTLQNPSSIQKAKKSPTVVVGITKPERPGGLMLADFIKHVPDVNEDRDWGTTVCVTVAVVGDAGTNVLRDAVPDSADRTTVAGSAASNHREHPAIVVGLKNEKGEELGTNSLVRLARRDGGNDALVKMGPVLKG